MPHAEPNIRQITCFRLRIAVPGNFNHRLGGKDTMIRRAMLASFVFLACSLFFTASESNAQEMQQRAYGRVWGSQNNMRDWERFYHYPYVYYPQNFWGNEYYRSSESMYYRYPQEMRVPIYNRSWHNYYPAGRRYHWGHHFQLDVF